MSNNKENVEHIIKLAKEILIGHKEPKNRAKRIIELCTALQPAAVEEKKPEAMINELLAEMNDIREKAKEKIKGRTNRLSEAYIEGQTCIDVINHLSLFWSKLKTPATEHGTEGK